MKIHPAAELFPMLGEAELKELANDIKAHGLRHPITMHKGKLLDGRNRYAACKMAEVEPEFVEFSGGDPIGFIVSENIHRRHLNESQRGLIGDELRNMDTGRPEKVANVPTKISRSKASNMVNVSERTIAKARKVKQERPDLIPAIRSGELTLGKAEATIKKEKRKADIEAQKMAIETGNAKLPEGVFEVVVLDPPWNYGREYDPETSRVANPYPEMDQSKLLDLAPPFADDCVCFLWTTHAFIWDAKELLDHWGFSYKATMVWDKEKIGMGAWLRMQCEFCLVGIKGKPTWENTKWRDIIREPRRQHSRKPDVFYRMVEEITVGRRLDYFSRAKKDGWEVFGNDTDKF